ncbi:hypothetical protein MMC09_001174 [Bachmanniomyces sp. S44760]|nr:hypothetical protein [Bachmanniomyces sp. S44760]
MTAVGFSTLESINYVEAVQKLRPDIVVGLADVVHDPTSTPGLKRVEKMGDRSLAWMKQLLTAQSPLQVEQTSIFAPILPIEKGLQAYYLEHLSEDDDLKAHIRGVVLYDRSSREAIPRSLSHFPRLALTLPADPHRLLEEISIGFDIFTIPFIGAATDAGIALDFLFPPPTLHLSSSSPRSELQLGIDMWDPEHSHSLLPCVEQCACYTCTEHHRAYLQHLLSAKEMLGWVLLQIHNHAMMDMFFEGVRRSITQGNFEQDRVAFGMVYERDLPAKTGLGPRVRGYQYASTGPGEVKKNPRAYRPLSAATAFVESEPSDVRSDGDLPKLIREQGHAGTDELEIGWATGLGFDDGITVEEEGTKTFLGSPNFDS